MTDYNRKDEKVGEKIAKFLQWGDRKNVTSKPEDVNGSGCSSHTNDMSLCQHPEVCWYEIRLILYILVIAREFWFEFGYVFIF